MVERCHRTLELVIKKVIQKREDWYPFLNSVLFSMHSQTHSSMGYSPIRMLYNKDPILPFEMADKLENGGHTDESESCNEEEQDATDHSERIIGMVEVLEQKQKEIFSNADKKFYKLKNIKLKVTIGDILLGQNLRLA